MKTHRLPLGIDIGSTGIRIAEYTMPGPALRNVVTAPLSPSASEVQIAEALRDLITQLHTKERRCIFTLDDRSAIVREIHLPPMPRADRMRAARLEAERFPASEQECSAYLVRSSANSFAVGSISAHAIARLVRIAQAAKLRVIAIDHASYAFSRVYPHCDAVVDIGHYQTRFYALKANVPLAHVIDIGGDNFTRAVARAFTIDEESAEGRKRMHGIAPAGDAEISAIVQFTGRAMRAARASGISDIERIILTGNGARLPLLPARLERDTGCLVEIATRIGLQTHFPDDIMRAAAPDWALAAGTALWSIAEEAAA